MESDFSKLSYELQFKFLLSLNFRDTMNYCESSKSTLNICADPYFWEQKALNNFQIPLNIMPKNLPSEQYRALENYFYNSPGKLAVLILKKGLTNRVVDLINRTKFYHYVRTLYVLDSPLIDYILNYATDLGDPVIVQAIIDKLQEELSEEDWIEIQGSIERSVFKALRGYRRDLYEILSPYHQPRYDRSLSQFHDALLSGDIMIVKYLRSIIDNQVFELTRTLRSQSPALLKDFQAVYPDLLRDPRFVTQVAIELIATNQLPALTTLNKIAHNMIDRREVETLLARYQNPKFTQEILSLIK